MPRNETTPAPTGAESVTNARTNPNASDPTSETPDPPLTRSEKISRALKGRPSGFQGKHHTRETRERISQSVAEYREWQRAQQGGAS